MNNWPPTDEQIRDIACQALNKSTKKEINVLVYWDNPGIMIYDPFHFAQTDYIRKKFKTEDRTVEVNIGRQD
jgi:hypothetical protein